MPLVTGSRLLATNTLPQEFTNNDQKACVANYFDSKLKELNKENREYSISTNSDQRIYGRTVRKTGFFLIDNTELDKEISLISYYSRGKDLNPIGVIREDGEINRDDIDIADNLDRSFVCRHISKSWLTGDLKLSQINSVADLRKSKMVIKNGDTPEGIKKLFDDIEDGIKICNLDSKDILRVGLSTDNKIDNYFKQYLSKSEYTELLSLREAFFAIVNDECLDGVSDKNSIHEQKNYILSKIYDILENSKTLSVVSLIHIIHTSAPSIGKLVSNSNNDDIYSFSKNNFQPLLRELCETIYNRTEDSSESFQWFTRNHAMGLKIAKKDQCLKITFYDPNNTIAHDFILKSPKDADKITISVLLSPSDQKEYKIIDNNITGFDDLHANTLVGSFEFHVGKYLFT